MRTAEVSLKDVVCQSLAEEFGDSLYHSFVPTFSYVQEKRSETVWLLDRQITELVPLYGYTMEKQQEVLQEDEFLSLDEIMLAEAQEGTSSEQGVEVSLEEALGGLDENGQDLSQGGIALEGATLEELLLAENTAAQNGGQQAGLQSNGQQAGVQQMQGQDNDGQAVEQQGAGALQQSATAAENTFVPHAIQAQVNLEELKNYEKLVSDFYTIDANTMAGSELLEVGSLLEKDMTISKEAEGPQILIYHTHSQEGFADSVPGDTSTTIVGVGDRLTELLTNTYGYQVLHHTGQYDVASRDDAYSESLPAIEQVLAENPSIQVVIDLHRDEMPEETKLVMDLDGRPTARFMFFNGLSRTRKTGNISYLYNENLGENLAFSFQMQLKAAEYYPGLTRKIYLKGYRYNMHLRPRTLLIELGAQNNTVEEAMNACDPLAHILDMVLSGQG